MTGAAGRPVPRPPRRRIKAERIRPEKTMPGECVPGQTAAFPDMNDDHDPQLRRALESWKVLPPPAPNFKSNVWQRIATEEESGARTLGQRLRDWFFI